MPVRCVLVDDNRDFLRAARDLLEVAGITVVGVAQTGEQADQACSELQPDVVLVDIELGPESGFEVARTLIGQAGPYRPCVILTSAYSAEDFGEMMAETPAVSFLSKSTLSGSAVLSILASARGTSPRHHRDSR